jgi:pyruvate/2-oxoglutarate dehydrogenase complex dihydrolipoamide dehydrogenase (E3) component
MSEVYFDFIVIGGGSAGYAAARTFHGDGYKVAVVDGGKPSFQDSVFYRDVCLRKH